MRLQATEGTSPATCPQQEEAEGAGPASHADSSLEISGQRQVVSICSAERIQGLDGI